MLHFGTLARLALGGLAVILVSASTGLAATNQIPASRMKDIRIPITANSLKPAECAGLNLTNVVVGSGTFEGTNGSDLILGRAGDDTIDGLDGDDCILGGGGDDAINGGGGNDACIGGAGRNTLANCKYKY